ncbi:hypothetical protein D7X55_26785 [Corallococcus sp. AB049A]|uniref:hypothetical protein n=1 Tax=Corallococcus sp. AB049A TaxID=2316721 RepID=UPI000EA095D6|nr:hypothetical protein [Corallococcus sp. AB049A]RKI58739.1 hypothetical protein D7X55_26785 [Corallococcus sp. AB049A]
MDFSKKAVDVLSELRGRGLTVEQALNEMRGMKLGLINVVKALRAVEGMRLRDAVDLMDSRGDSKEF